jgi:hypothetical protein
LIDGVLPRLMQAWEGLQDDPNITVLVDYNLPKFPVVQKIWEYLLPADRLVVFNPETIFQYPHPSTHSRHTHNTRTHAHTHTRTRCTHV